MNARFSYVANAPLVSQIGFTNRAMWMKTTKANDNVNRMTSLSSSSSIVYGLNPASQRTSITTADGSWDGRS